MKIVATKHFLKTAGLLPAEAQNKLDTLLVLLRLILKKSKKDYMPTKKLMPEEKKQRKIFGKNVFPKQKSPTKILPESLRCPMSLIRLC